jgi:hypothetical protein
MRLLICLLITISGAIFQDSAPGEADGILAQLSKIRLDKKQVHSIRDLTLRRDVMSVSLTRGLIAFTQPVNGKVTGAVFIGTGEVIAIPPDTIEKQQIYKFTSTPILDETFQTAVLRFTDDTYGEIQRELSQHAQEDLSDEDTAQFDSWVERIGENTSSLNRRLAADLAEPSSKQTIFLAQLNSDRLGWFNAVFDLRAPEEVSIFQVNNVAGTPVADVWARFNQRSKARNREAAAHAAPSPTDLLLYNKDAQPVLTYSGHSVQPDSYHDDWFIDGLNRYLAATDWSNPDESALRRLLESSREQLKPVESTGAIWLGRRLSSTRAPAGYRAVAAKGVWVIHMIRTLLRNSGPSPDQRFLAMTKEFVETFDGRPASTWDFKRVVEKYAGQKLDWFFDDWVFGVGVPTYALEYQVEASGNAFTVQGKLKQANVPDGFAMPVPIYADDEFLGNVSAADAEGEFHFKTAKRPDKVTLDPHKDILTFE